MGSRELFVMGLNNANYIIAVIRVKIKSNKILASVIMIDVF